MGRMKLVFYLVDDEGHEVGDRQQVWIQPVDAGPAGGLDRDMKGLGEKISQFLKTKILELAQSQPVDGQS